MAFATGKYALGICDICGQHCDYLLMLDYVENERFNGLKVCKDCYDKDNPQLQVGRLSARPEGIALQDPRPDNWDRFECTIYWAWAPTTHFQGESQLGQTTVSSS